jgi:hypothetical protein
MKVDSMIKIIAIQPEVMSTPKGIREYLKDFGTARGRWIPLVPKDWRRCVSQAIKLRTDLGVIESNKLRDKITNPRNQDKFLKIEECPESTGDWNEVVNNFLTDRAFDGAIVSSPVDSNPKFLVAHQFDPEIESYSVKTSKFVARKPDELVAPILPILRFARELHVIDVYCKSLGSSTKSYATFFEHLLVWCRINNPNLKSITLHRRHEGLPDMVSERINYESWILPILGAGESFHVHYLRQRDDGDGIHGRAVFTDCALVTGHYGYGGVNSEHETTDIVLREHQDLLKIRSDYLNKEKRAFDLVTVLRIPANDK